MYVCICHAITDKQIQNEVYNGANCLKSLQKKLPVATNCGTCACDATDIIENTLCEIKRAMHNQVA